MVVEISFFFKLMFRIPAPKGNVGVFIFVRKLPGS